MSEMGELTRIDGLAYICRRLLENAKWNAEKARKDKNDPYFAGCRQASYEMMDILKTELEVYGVDLSAVGLDIDLEKELL